MHSTSGFVFSTASLHGLSIHARSPLCFESTKFVFLWSFPRSLAFAPFSPCAVRYIYLKTAWCKYICICYSCITIVWNALCCGGLYMLHHACVCITPIYCVCFMRMCEYLLGWRMQNKILGKCYPQMNNVVVVAVIIITIACRKHHTHHHPLIRALKPLGADPCRTPTFAVVEFLAVTAIFGYSWS